MDNQKLSVFIEYQGSSYPIFKLFQTKKDPSIYLHLYRHKSINKSGVGKIDFTSPTFLGRINYDSEVIEFKPIDHSSIHKDGNAHIKFFDKTYLSRTKGLPLENLKSARQLWTIIPGTLKEEDAVIDLPKKSFAIHKPSDVGSLAIVIFASPKYEKLNFNFPFPEDDFTYDKVDKNGNVQFPLNIFAFPFNQYTICLLTYSTTRFKFEPPITYALSDIYNLAPFVTAMERNYMEIELRELISELDNSSKR